MKGEVKLLDLESIGAFILFFLLSSFTAFFWSRNLTMGLIDEGYNPTKHPKRYVVPVRWIRKLFKIKKQFIPRYCYFRLFLTLFYFALAPINIIIGIISGFSPFVMWMLVMILCCLGIVDIIVYAIATFILKR